MSAAADLLLDLIRFDTRNPGGDERPLAEHLAGLLRRFGPDHLSVTETGGGHVYVLAVFGAARVLVNAHLDTVPASPGWSRDPFSPHIEGGRLWGLGSADTKGAIAAILAAMSQQAPRDVAVLFSGDEEHGNSTMRTLVSNPPPGLRSVTRAVVCEPTSLRVGTRHRGLMAFSASVSGEGGHSSRADTLPRPVAQLAHVAASLDDWGRARATSGPPGFPGMCMNVAELRGGVAFNVVPASAELIWSVRPPPGTPLEEVHASMAGILASSDVSWKTVLENPSFETRDLGAFRELFGARLDHPVDLGFWTEAALLSQSGIDAVVWGPGDIAVAHAPDEFVPLADLLAATQVFGDILSGPV